jgi:hypothetical protein
MGDGANGTYTCTSLTVMDALGVRGKRKSVLAIRAATMKQTVVKKPNTFWVRVTVECILASWAVPGMVDLGWVRRMGL